MLRAARLGSQRSLRQSVEAVIRIIVAFGLRFVNDRH
jgi:hypothetical protein